MRSHRQTDAERDASLAARITCQFRDRRSMVYELDCGSSKLALTMSEAPPPSGLWQAGASVRQPGASPALSASGPSRGEALSAVAREWERLGALAGYPNLDWTAIRAALAAVRAV